MSREIEELQFLGFLGIFVEACNLITFHRKIFFKIALPHVLLTFVLSFSHIQISDRIPDKTGRNLETTTFPVTFLLFSVVRLFEIVLSMLCISAVVHTVACTYTAKNVSFRKVLKVLPKIFKRLVVTSVCSFGIIFVFICTFLLLLIICFLFATNNSVTILIVIILALFYIFGLIYIAIIWYLASVVSIIGDVYGLPALQKSKNLVRGKKWTVFVVLLVLQFPLKGVELLVFGQRMQMGLGGKLVTSVVITTVFLLSLVIKTIVYFVCKSYHQESIDKSTLSDHLNVFYSEEYVPLKEEDMKHGEDQEFKSKV